MPELTGDVDPSEEKVEEVDPNAEAAKEYSEHVQALIQELFETYEMLGISVVVDWGDKPMPAAIIERHPDTDDLITGMVRMYDILLHTSANLIKHVLKSALKAVHVAKAKAGTEGTPTEA